MIFSVFVDSGTSLRNCIFSCKQAILQPQDIIFVKVSLQDPAGRKLNISEYLFLFLVFVRVGYTGQGRIRPIQHQSFSAVRKTARWSTEIVSR